MTGRWRHFAAAGVPALALALAGCGTTEPLGDTTGSAQSSFTTRVSQLFATQAAAPAPAPEDAAKPQYSCPSVTIRTGAAAHPVLAQGRDGIQALRYQATIGQTARECAALGQMMTMKVGVEGRLLAGPAGGPGKVDIPVRIAVVHEGPSPKTVWTKFYRVPVQMPEGQTQATFLHIEEDLSFPLPTAEELEEYIVYVGFDATGKPEKNSRQPR